MGASASVVVAKKLDERDIADCLTDLGPTYEDYKRIIVENKISGEKIAFRMDDLDSLLHENGISHEEHKATLVKHLTKVLTLSQIALSPRASASYAVSKQAPKPAVTSGVASLEDARREIDRLNSIIATMSENIKQERRNMSTEVAMKEIIAKTSAAATVRREMFIVHFNDIYDYNSNAKENFGGAARCAWQIKNFTEDAPLIINSGDFLSPSPTSNVTKGAHMVQIMNAMSTSRAFNICLTR